MDGLAEVASQPRVAVRVETLGMPKDASNVLLGFSLFGQTLAAQPWSARTSAQAIEPLGGVVGGSGESR